MAARRSSAIRTGLLVALVLAPCVPASARELWIVSDQAKSVKVFDSATNGIVGGPIAVGKDPRAIAISLDGRTAYVANKGDNTLSVIDTQTKTAKAPIALGSFKPDAVAVSPDGARILVGGSGGLEALDPATGALLGTPWGLFSPSPPSPRDVAITPDGTRAFTPMSPHDGTVAIFDLSTYGGQEQTAFNRPNVGCSPCDLRAAAASPDGSRVVIGGDVNAIINTTTGALSNLTTGHPGNDVAITPDGASAYVAGGGPGDSLWRYVLPAGTADGSIVAPDPFGWAIAVNPAGDRLYFAGGTLNAYKLYVLDEATHAPLAPAVALPNTPVAMAFVPDQGPVASVTASGGGAPGSEVKLDASASADADGVVRRYDWDFGDGTAAANAGPRPIHVYRSAGTYAATVTVTDTEGCTTRLVYTGQTAYCNGGPTAKASVPIVITGPDGGTSATPAPSSDTPTVTTTVTPPTSTNPAPKDTTPPHVKLSGSTVQPLGSTVKLTVTCDEACTASADGTLTVTAAASTASSAAAKGRTRRFVLVRAAAKLARGQSRTLRLALPRSARRLLAHHGARGVARIRTRVVDASGNVRHARRTIVVRRRR